VGRGSPCPGVTAPKRSPFGINSWTKHTNPASAISPYLWCAFGGEGGTHHRETKHTNPASEVEEEEGKGGGGLFENGC
jgi:hypothetical protein